MRLPALALDRWRTVLIAGVAIAILFAVLFAWRSVKSAPTPQAAPPPVDVVATVIAPQAAPLALEAVGAIQAVREVTLAAETAGRVVAINFQAGARVGAGAHLVQLYDHPERADRAAAQARADFARLQFGRSRDLAPTGAEPRERFEQRRAELDQAIAAVQQIDARLTQKQIRAPFAGQLGIRRVNLGQYLNPGDAVVTLTDLDQIHINFTLPQQELSRLRVGSPVAVTSDAWPGRSFTARLSAIEPQVGAETRNVALQATLANPDHALRPGMYVTAALTLPPEAGAILVPTTAIQTSVSGDAVTVVRGASARRSGKAEIVPVTTGRRIGNAVVVTKGLRAGDVVVTEGQLRIQPGAQLKVVRTIAAAGV